MDDDEALQRAIRDACLGESLAHKDERLPPRIAIYRTLVRNALSGVVHNILVATRREMGEPFDRAFTRFLAERGPKTHFLRDVPHEFVEHATPHWRSEGVAPWLLDLARHEMTSFGVSTAPHLPEAHPADISLERPLLLSSLTRIERYSHAIHEALPPPERAVTLLYYRDINHALCTLELSPMAATLLEHAHLPLREAVAKAGAVTDEALASVARLLADLGERGVLLGAR
jgi:hypothetical protein